MTQSITDPQAAASNTLVTESQVVEMMQDLFDSMLGESILPTEERPGANSEWLQASIMISGDQRIRIAVGADKQMSDLIARKMFLTEELAEEEIQDALGEVVNVIGGNIKGVFNQECALSLPCIGQHEPIAKEKFTCSFASQGHALTVTIV